MDNVQKCPNLLLLVQFVFSINCSNAFCERVFSVMKALWRDERNKLDIETVRAELFTSFNINMHCDDFHTMVKSCPSLQKAASSSAKYKPRMGK